MHVVDEEHERCSTSEYPPQPGECLEEPGARGRLVTLGERETRVTLAQFGE
jgi:hypothetical protein